MLSFSDGEGKKPFCDETSSFAVCKNATCRDFGLTEHACSRNVYSDESSFIFDEARYKAVGKNMVIVWKTGE